jgi:hypothetical protein
LVSNIQAIQTGPRSNTNTKISQTLATRTSESPEGTHAMNESDSNADTCCLGCNFIVLHYTQRKADVYAYDSNYAPITNVPIVTGATAWTDPNSQITLQGLFNLTYQVQMYTFF